MLPVYFVVVLLPAMSSLAPRLVPDDQLAAAVRCSTGVYGSLAAVAAARPSAA